MSGPAGIPTEYAGITFRSRLEATWARFFDLVGWEWQYEPLDCRGWVPDFGPRSAYVSPRPVLVEVKPISSFDEATALKIDAADRGHEVLLLGLGPWGSGDGDHRIGWLREVGSGGSVPEPWLGWGEAPLGIRINRRCEGENPWQGPDSTLGFRHAEQAFVDRITGRYAGGHRPCTDRAAILTRQCWAEAKNATRWRPAGGRSAATRDRSPRYAASAARLEESLRRIERGGFTWPFNGRGKL